MTWFWLAVCIGFLAGAIAGILQWQERERLASSRARLAESIKARLGKGVPGPPEAP